MARILLFMMSVHIVGAILPWRETMSAVITLLTGRVFDMSLRDIILQKKRGKITEVLLLATTIGMGTITAIWQTIMPEMNIAMVTQQYPTA